MQKFLVLLATFIAATGCINQGAGPAGVSAQTGATSTTKTAANTPTTKLAFTMTTANTALPAGGAANAVPIFTLIFNANTSTTLNDVCQVQTGTAVDPTKACKCHFVWNETNLSDTSVIQRIVDTAPTQITNFQTQCNAPAVFNDEIRDGTVIKITLIPDTNKGNNSGFTTNVLNFTKQPVTATGDFRDSEGRSFRNVMHYVCYDKLSKNLSIARRSTTGETNPITNLPTQLTAANDFSVGTSGSPTSFSGQSYYFDFYVRSNEAGSINAANGSFTCPQVNINGISSFFPFDSSFALAVNTSADFSVQVIAQTVIPVNGSSPGTLIGFATKPNADSTCPSFVDSSGRIRRTFRLRQYSAIYPLRFDADGNIKDQSQPVNTIYILDRPVDKVGQDPLKPITRLGPKPCPFSFKTAQFGQKCTTDASLNGFNVDGTQIDGDAGCPIYPPVPNKYLKTDGTLVIRPFKPFLPHYLENTSFKACAFQSSTPSDPEIVLSHDDAIFPIAAGPNDFYCSKNYPAVGAIIPPPGGDPFDKAPGDCDLGANGAAIKTDKTYACSRTFNPTNSALNTPAAGCCQVCSGGDCTAVGGGTNAAGRNAAFAPPHNSGNPAQSINQLPRAIPNKSAAPSNGGCFDPFEN